MARCSIYPSQLLHGAALHQNTAVHVEDGQIVDVQFHVDPRSRRESAVPSAISHDLDGTLLPGLIDLQLNGAGGRGVEEMTDDALDAIACAVELGGASAFLPTLITAPFDLLLEQVRAVAGWIERRDSRAEGATPLGIHVEGPFLEVGGTHDTGHFIDPTPERIHALLSAARGDSAPQHRDHHLAMVTMAPSRAGAIEAVRALTDAQVCTAFGHANGTDQFGACVDAGASMVTHLFNAMSPLHHRAPGITGHALDEGRLSCALILDGVHVDPIAARVAYRCLGPERTILVTDAVAAAGMPDGTYQLAGKAIDLRDGVVRDAEGRLAGSALTMRGAAMGVRSMLNDDDPKHLAQMAARNCARLIHREDSWGQITTGFPAKLTLLAADGTIEALRF